MSKIERIYLGDSLDVLKSLDDNSVESVVTDPPYGLSKDPDISEVLTKWLAGEEYDHGHGGFMGKTWDSFVPHPDIWREVYRVLKPGGHALVFAGTRTQDLMTISLRLAGFEVRDVIEWLYFSGFPKSHDVGKAFDRRNGRNYPDDKFREYLKERAKSAGITGTQVDRALGTNGMWGHYTGRSQPAFPTVDAWERLKPLINIDERYDDIIYHAEAERRKIGEGSSGKTYVMGGLRGEQTSEGVYDITAPATDLARKWDGWGTSLKPSHEPIIVVRKPLIDADTGRKLTIADCVEKYGTGAINIDSSRISMPDADEYMAKQQSFDGTDKRGIANGVTMNKSQTQERKSDDYVVQTAEKGRFPANCITLDSDEFYSKYFNVANVTPAELSKKASKKDRNSDWQGEEIEGNVHPTVKPTDLMAWLVRLITPAGGTVLDPFAGSGSTLVAAKREGFGFIGVELTEEYIPIIEARTGTKAQATEGQATE